MASKKPTELLIEEEKTKREYFNGGKDVALTLARSPIMQMLAFCVLVETLQSIELPNGRPVLSDFLAGALETTVVTAKTIETVAGSLDDAVSIVQAVKPSSWIPTGGK